MRSSHPQLPLPARAAAAMRIASRACCVARHIASVSCSRLMASDDAQQSRLCPCTAGQQSPL
eukprot:scaffold123152_cov45-Phaeocystis_antarctica.AAC.2